MIITMKPDANKLMLEKVVKEIVSQGFDVQVQDKNGNGRYIIAVLGSGSSTIIFGNNISGIERKTEDNSYFSEHYLHFKEAWQFFSSWGF